jgi:hypothetical protein
MLGPGAGRAAVGASSEPEKEGPALPVLLLIGK